MATSGAARKPGRLCPRGGSRADLSAAAATLRTRPPPVDTHEHEFCARSDGVAPFLQGADLIRARWLLLGRGAIAVANGIAWVVSGLVALFAGAWLAGRLASTRHYLEGGLHGLGVWGAGAVVMLVLAFGSAGVVGSEMLGVAGKRLDSAGAVAQIAAPKWTAIQAQFDPAMDTTSSSASVASAGAEASVGDGAAGSSGSMNNRLIARSRLFDLADRHFIVGRQALGSGERDRLVQLIAAHTKLSTDAAERALKQRDSVWARSVQTYETSKHKAVDAAKTARFMAMAAEIWAFAAMIIGAAAAMFGGAYGTRCRLRALEREQLLVENGTTLRRAQLRDDASSRAMPRPLA